MDIWIEKYGKEIAEVKYKELLAQRGIKISKTKTGRKYSLEYRQAISKSLTGRKLSEQEKQIRKIKRDLKGPRKTFTFEEIEKFKYLHYECGISIKKIIKLLKTSRKTLEKFLKANNLEFRKQKNQHK